MAVLAGVPERPKGAGCKPAGSAYEGSNPSPCIVQSSAPRSNPRGAGRAGERGRALPLDAHLYFPPTAECAAARWFSSASAGRR